MFDLVDLGLSLLLSCFDNLSVISLESPVLSAISLMRTRSSPPHWFKVTELFFVNNLSCNRGNLHHIRSIIESIVARSSLITYIISFNIKESFNRFKKSNALAGVHLSKSSIKITNLNFLVSSNSTFSSFFLHLFHHFFFLFFHFFFHHYS